jgi:hypothetical protein
MRRLTKISLTFLSLSVSASLFAGCGDNLPAIEQDAGTDGTIPTGGAGGTAGGAGSGAAGAAGKGGGGAGGAAGQGGGGAGAVGGSIGGATAGQGGGGTGAVGGSLATGGAGGSLGGSGGTATGGGGTGVGGVGGGNVGVAGSGTGGSTTVSCDGLAFTAPLTGETLTAADDATGDACGNGFQFNVTASVSAPDGTTAALVGTSGATTTTLATTTTTGGKVRFANVMLPTGGTVLGIKLGTMSAVCSTTSSVTVDCTAPIVTIVSPAADTATFGDVSKHLLSASSTQAFKDTSSASAGAQTTVVACTNRIGTANLLVGPAGGTLTQTGSTVTSAAALAADNCPSGLRFSAKFVGVTLPESAVNPDGTLSKATELRVDVTDAANTASIGSSSLRDVWVDSVAPIISESAPSPLCGGSNAGPATFTTTVAFISSTSNVMLSITNGGATKTLAAPGYDGTVATFSNVAFAPGLNTLAVTATDAAGNSTVLTPAAPSTSCAFSVGQVPVVSFVNPPLNAKLCAAGNTTTACVPDSTAGTAGWQGTITVAVTVGGAPVITGDDVTFTIGAGAPQTVALDGTGHATLAAASIPDAAAATVTVTTANIGGNGTGTTISTFVVDTAAPAAPVSLLATVFDRRQTSFSLDWKAPSDGTGSLAGYTITVTDYNETTSACGTNLQATVPFVGIPKIAGGAENVIAPNLYIESHYCFSIVAVDTVGNMSAPATTDGVARFNATVLTGSGTESFGIVTDGTGDFGAPGGSFANDRLSDLLVGTNAGQNAYLFFGRAGGYPATADVVFTGPPAKAFGQGVVAAGDIDGDGLTDIAISAPGTLLTDTPTVYIFSRKTANSPFKSAGGGWPATVDYTQASYVITADASYGLTLFGQIIARLGNFDGSGSDDLGISAFIYNPATGASAGRVVVVKGSSSFASVTLPDTANTIVIDGEMAGDRFGRAMQGLPDGTMVVSSPRANGQAGKLYAFRAAGLAQSNVANMTTAYDITSYTAAANPAASYGLNLSTLGPLGQSMGVVVASATGSGGNFVDVHMVPASDGIFGGAKGSTAAPTVHFISSITPNSLGIINIGSQVSGSTQAGSLIGGDAVPDLVIAGQGDPNRTMYIVSGASITGMSGTVDLATTPVPAVVAIKNGSAPGTIRIPSDWANFGRESSLVLDLNGDGYSDFSLSEAAAGKPGRALVFW